MYDFFACLFYVLAPRIGWICYKEKKYNLEGLINNIKKKQFVWLIRVKSVHALVYQVL